MRRRLGRRGQGPPAHWVGAAYDPRDPRTWGGIPPFMDPRYAGRMEMAGMHMYPPTMRRRTDSHGSGTDSQENESRSNEQYERDPREMRAWMERGYPPPHGAYEDMRRAPYFDHRMYPEYERFDYDRKDYDHSEHGDDEHQQPRDRRNSGPADADKSVKTVEHRITNPRSPVVQKDPFDDGAKDDKKIETWEAPDKHEKTSVETRRQKPASDKREEKESDYRRKEEWGGRFTGSSSSSRQERAPQRAWVSADEGKSRRDHHTPSCPPPIPPQQTQAAPPPRSNFMALKRSSSNNSTSSAASSERKSDSPKEPVLHEKPLNIRKESSRESVKKEPLREVVNVPDSTKNETVWSRRQNEKIAQKEKQESSQSDSVNESRETKEKKVDKESFEEKTVVEKRDRGGVAGGKDRPPAKKKKEEPYVDRFDRDRNRSMPGRGREFVRSRGRGRARGMGPMRGGGRGRGDYHSMDRPYRGPKMDKAPSFGHWKDQTHHNEGAENEEVDMSKRRRGRDEESDVSVDETSGTFSESSSERTSEARELGAGKDKDKENKDVKLSKETKEEINNTQKSAGLKKMGMHNDDRGRARPNTWNRERRYEGGHKSYNENSDGKDKMGGFRNYNSGPMGGFTPRGEPSRRGRGSSQNPGPPPRGGRGRGRWLSAPPQRGGFGRPPMTNGDRRDFHDMGSQNRRDRRQERNPPPPRFARRGGIGGERGRGFERGGRGNRGKSRGASVGGAGSSGGGGGGGSSGSATPATTSKKPPLTKQTSNEGEEWETASESSEILEKKDTKNEVKDANKDKRDQPTKKSFSSQRPLNDRQNRRVNNSGGDPRKANSVERRNKERSPNSTKNGAGPAHSVPRAKATVNVNHKENVTSVFRVDGIVPNNPAAINNAINSMNNRNKTNGKRSDLSAVSKTMRTDKEKKDALANIDINNYASVVVIDDQPEVTIDDPNFLFETNDGFQEVTSKKTSKIRQKRQEAEQKKMSEMQHRKRDASSKVIAKPKGLTPKTERARFSKISRLPPRFAKQKEQREKEKEATNDVMPKIEQWDNDLANNIPGPANNNGGKNAQPQQQTQGPRTPKSPNQTPPAVVSIAMAPAPIPTVSAWTKPINFSVTLGTSSQSPPIMDGKLDKGDQHDSGIDVSDQPNSTASSTRSSPSAENKDESKEKLLDEKISKELDDNYGMSKAQRQQKVRTERMGMKSPITKVDSNKAVKKPDPIRDTKPEPIQMPPSMKNGFFKSTDTGLKLEFEFDEALTSFQTEAPHVEKSCELVDVPKSVSLTSVSVTDNLGISSPTSHAAQDLNQKIAAVKSVWEINPGPFEPTLSNVSSLASALSTSSDNNSSAGSYTTFTSDVDNVVSATPIGLEAIVNLGEAVNLSPRPNTLSPRLQDIQVYVPDVELKHDKMHLIEPSNICKVKPQQFQTHAGGSPIIPNMSAVPSPPIVMPNPYQPIQLGSQLITQEPPRVGSSSKDHHSSKPCAQKKYNDVFHLQQFSQQSYGFSLSQPQAQIGQTQPSLFLHNNPSQGDMFQSNTQLTPFPRNQPYGQTPPQPNTIMVSSATTSLMSTSIKPPTQTAYTGQLQKSMTPSSMQFGQNMNNSSLPPSQMYIQYDASHTLFGGNPLLGSTQNTVNNSQILGSQLMQSRNPVQNVQPVQQTSSFFQQTQPSLQQNFYQQPTSALQGALQQAAATGQQFSLPAFGNQASGLGLTLNPASHGQGLGMNPQQPSKPSQQYTTSTAAVLQQQQSPQNTPIKSPPQSLSAGMMGGSSQVNNSKNFAGQMTNRNTAAPPSGQRFQFQTKFNSQFMAQPIQTPGASVVRHQMMVGNLVRQNAPPQQRPSYPNPIQRPALQIPVASSQQPGQFQFQLQQAAAQQQQAAAQQQHQQQAAQQQQQQQQQLQQHNSSQSPSLQAQRLKDRRELLAHAHTFLKNPAMKSAPKGDTASSDAAASTTASTAPSAELKPTSSQEKK